MAREFIAASGRMNLPAALMGPLMRGVKKEHRVPVSRYNAHEVWDIGSVVAIVEECRVDIARPLKGMLHPAWYGIDVVYRYGQSSRVVAVPAWLEPDYDPDRVPGESVEHYQNRMELNREAWISSHRAPMYTARVLVEVTEVYRQDTSRIREADVIREGVPLKLDDSSGFSWAHDPKRFEALAWQDKWAMYWTLRRMKVPTEVTTIRFRVQTVLE